MIQVNRGDFIAWVQGDLLVRDVKGRCLVGDNQAHEDAEAAMNQGKTIGLLVNGQVVSTMRLTREGYVEEAAVQRSIARRAR